MNIHTQTHRGGRWRRPSPIKSVLELKSQETEFKACTSATSSMNSDVNGRNCQNSRDNIYEIML
jgi:hypothetical protein